MTVTTVTRTVLGLGLTGIVGLGRSADCYPDTPERVQPRVTLPRGPPPAGLHPADSDSDLGTTAWLHVAAPCR